MSPIDDELRRTLSGRAAEVAPMADPIAGIEVRAHRMHRQRQAIAAACAVVAFAGGAAVVPLLTHNTSPTPPTNVSPTATAESTSESPSASASPSPSPSPAASATPSPTAAPAESSASVAPPVSPSSPTPTAEGTAIGVYYLGDNGTRTALYREFRKSPAPDRVRAAVELMLAKPLDPDYTTLWPAGTTVRGVTVAGDVATVDLSAQARGGAAGSAAACLTLQQLVWTVTAADTSIKQVALSIEGQTQGIVSQWWGVGCGADAPMTRHTPSYEVLAPVQISTYNEGDQVKSRFSFGGEATVFEATVSWSVVDAAGKQLAGGSTNASVGAPERGGWQAIVVLDGVQKGDVVQLRAWETSMKDGSVQDLDTKTVTISG